MGCGNVPLLVSPMSPTAIQRDSPQPRTERSDPTVVLKVFKFGRGGQHHVLRQVGYIVGRNSEPSQPSGNQWRINAHETIPRIRAWIGLGVSKQIFARVHVAIRLMNDVLFQYCQLIFLLHLTELRIVERNSLNAWRLPQVTPPRIEASIRGLFSIESESLSKVWRRREKKGQFRSFSVLENFPNVVN